MQYVFGYVLIELEDVAAYRNERIDAKEVNENTYIGVDNLLPEKAGKKSSDYVPAEGRLIKFEIGDILIGNIRPYLKKIWQSDITGGTNGDVLAIRVLNQDIVYPRYLYHVMASEDFFAYDNRHSKGAKMPRGDKQAVMHYQFALPRYEDQKEIASLLDRFDALCNDITEGLPAEIEARRQRYEYYRDKLLTFKEL